MTQTPRQGDTSAEVIRLPGSQGPARGYTWEPFKAANFAAKRHGAYSDRVIVPIAAQIANDLLAELPYLQDPTYREALLDYARTVARVEVLEKWLDENGEIRDDGSVAPAAIYLIRVRGHAAAAASRLGLDPLSRAKLGKDVTSSKLDFAQLMAQLAESSQPGGDSA